MQNEIIGLMYLTLIDYITLSGSIANGTRSRLPTVDDACLCVAQKFVVVKRRDKKKGSGEQRPTRKAY
jgi:hypothetical protein